MRTLIFDCDGVLVDSEALAEGTLVEYLSRWLPDLNIDQELGQALGMTTAAILAHLEALSAHTLPSDATEQVDTAIEARLAQVPIFTADQVAHPKPDPALYRLAASHLGQMPRDCLVVEDSVAGVTAARAAGMCVIGFVGASHVDVDQAARLTQVGAWRILEHMHGLEALVNEWQAKASSFSP